MAILSKILIVLVTLEHFYILYIEMFSWEHLGKKTFKEIPKDLFKPTKAMAANQGLYNGFLAVGLLWTLFISNPIWSNNIALFFLGCIIIAGIYGSLSISKKILYTQAIPAAAAFICILLS
ncbi:DUF1304 domain-containing protein [Tenacibaculum sp. Mcav3-52]|uniref:DUF1304 domain-containing protein n=1 Tax=unclassified Tenacibaculum TaxID=2635139 RepID=UPI0012E695CD|nr:DUF1304 domain-containing protein [Tenacibaculum sp. Mcav3-52]MCG7501188.1 DUF1304 domain-containing protein [Tenacibaculum sp. Mcav3-52]GFD80159.1 hypothetical protein KUL118_30210 [Tenacibaculum sp. KUL118]